MPETDDGFEQKACPECGEPKNALRNGKEMLLRCKCDWERGFFDRVKATIHPEFYEKSVKTLRDWHPAIYEPFGHWDKSRKMPTEEQRMVMAQKAAAIHAIYDFCFRKAEGGRVALEESVASGRNMFIRGPYGSGRGLLAASIKMMAAAKCLSATPVPACEYDIFKSEIYRAEALGQEGGVAKAEVGSKYTGVDMMVLENVRAESTINMAGAHVPRKFKAAGAVDAMMAERICRRGSMVVTSYSFVGEIADTFGDTFYDVFLRSDKTSLVLLLGKDEISRAVKSIRAQVQKITRSLQDKRQTTLSGTAIEKKVVEQEMEEYMYGLYFCEAFPDASPAPAGGRKDRMMAETEGDLDGHKSQSREVSKAVAEFNQQKREQGLEYKEGVRLAQQSAARKLGIASLDDNEAQRLGQVISLAYSWNRLREYAEEAKVLRDEISGV